MQVFAALGFAFGLVGMTTGFVALARVGRLQRALAERERLG